MTVPDLELVLVLLVAETVKPDEVTLLTDNQLRLSVTLRLTTFEEEILNDLEPDPDWNVCDPGDADIEQLV